MRESKYFKKMNRAATMNRRIAESELFPRIRDAELKLKEDEERLNTKYGKDFVRTGSRATTAQGKIGANRVKIEQLETSEFFATHTLNKDPSCAKYMPYNEVHYPKLFGTDKMPPEILQDGLWMSGFIDRALRGDDLGEKVSKKKRKKVNNEPGFISSTVGASLKEKSFIDQSKLSNISTAAGSSTISKNVSLDRADSLCDPYDDLESVGGDHEGNGSHKTSLKNLLKKDIKKAILSMSLTSAPFVPKVSAVSVDGVPGTSGVYDPMPSSAQTVKSIMTKFKPYLDTMVTAKEVRLKVQAAKKKIPTRMESVELEQVFEIQRIENEAVKFLQTFWRRYLRIRRWRLLVWSVFHVRTIQRYVRGMIARKWIARWFTIRNKIIVCWQAGIRRSISLGRTRRQFAFERSMVIKIQKIIRGKIGRARWMRIHRDIAASRIQAMWRGIVARCRFDKKWLQLQVLPVQNLTRRMISMRKFKEVKAELDSASSIIQRQFRAWRACKLLGQNLWNRELRYRTEIFLMLTNEEDYAQANLEKIVARLIKGGLRRLAETHVANLQKNHEAITAIENEIVVVNREKDNLSPRAILQGWLPELLSNLAEKRSELTKMKLAAVFDSYGDVRKVDDQLDTAIKNIEDAAEIRNRLSLWRDIEYFERRDMVYDKDVTMKKKIFQQEVSDEARKWKVVFRNSDGKPVKGKNKAGPEKMTYSAGVDVDLMANIKDEKGLLNAPRAGSMESIDNTMNKVTLQTYLDQVNTYQQLLNPLQAIMQRGLGAGGEGMQRTEDLGWGHEGNKLQKALAGIGVGEVEEDELEGLTYAERMALLGTKFQTGGEGDDIVGSRGGLGALGGQSMRGGSAGYVGGMKRPESKSMMSTEDHHLHVQFDEEDSDDDTMRDLRTDEGFMDDIDDRGLNGHQFSMSMSNIDVHGSNKPMAGPWGSKSLGGSSTGTGGGSPLRPLKGLLEKDKRAARREERRKARADRLPKGTADTTSYINLMRPYDPTHNLCSSRAFSTNNSVDFSIVSDDEDAFPDMKKKKKKAIVVCENKLDTPKFSKKFSMMFTERDELYELEGEKDGLRPGSSGLGVTSKRPPSRSIADVLSDARRMTLQAQEREKERVRMARKRDRKAATQRSAAIPWALLDELEGEKAKFESDCAHAELYHKF